ncbi:hypothetical protein SLS58_007820 [Diplodia intermedia]|uniref:Uncharacterized protein n=1 Tax=Diplodia intermedia TaxID=856260 RepID=A0ABR3TIY0_9PEZI
MPTILSDDDKQVVKRTVPKGSNKIHAVAVAKLYIAYPNRHKWTYTGLQGAAVLANDLVGNTFWIKLVDISPLNRGVIWDQEIYDTFQYNQDRTFFHTFELEQCLAGLSFADEKEAKQFKKKIDEREKNAHKNTKNKPFGMAAGTSNGASTNGGGHSHGLLGSLFGSHRHSSHQNQEQHSIIPPRKPASPASPPPNQNGKSSTIDTADPAMQPVLQELLQMGITADQIEENADFIKMYIEQKKASEATANESKSRAPPPPPSAPPASKLSPQNTGSTSTSRRGPPPAPPPARRKGGAPVAQPASPGREPSPPTQPRFRAPPPLADAGKFANQAPPPPARARGAPAPKMPVPAGGGGRDDLLASIRGGARLKKVSDTEKKDRSGAAVPGSSSSPPPTAGGGGGAGDGGGLANALASALAARKSKVSHSDDEDDDDW